LIKLKLSDKFRELFFTIITLKQFLRLIFTVIANSIQMPGDKIPHFFAFVKTAKSIFT